MNRKDALHKKLLQNPFLVLENAIFELLSEDIIQLRILPGTQLNEQLLRRDLSRCISPTNLYL